MEILTQLLLISMVSTYIDVPLCIWYLSFYCSPATKFAVISKILVLAFDNTAANWNAYIEKYIHTEEKIENSTMEFEIQPIFYEYDNSNLFKMAIYQIGYIVIAPMIGKLY